MPTTQYEWHKARLKPNDERFPGSSFSGGCSEKATGYGPQSDYSLFLPSPTVERKIVFVDGKATIEESGDLLSLPHILELRNRARTIGKVDDVSPTAATIFFPDAVLAEYSVALLRLNYNLTDEDLNFLHSGKRWMETIIVHAMGGKVQRDSLANADTRVLASAIVETEQRITRAIVGEVPANMEIIEGDESDYLEIEAAIENEELNLAQD